MGRFQAVAAPIAELPDARQDEMAALLEIALAGELDPDFALSAAQIAEIERQLVEPAPLASEEDVAAFFAEAIGEDA
jgi:hypothetical protein